MSKQPNRRWWKKWWMMKEIKSLPLCLIHLSLERLSPQTDTLFPTGNRVFAPVWERPCLITAVISSSHLALSHWHRHLLAARFNTSLRKRFRTFSCWSGFYTFFRVCVRKSTKTQKPYTLQRRTCSNQQMTQLTRDDKSTHILHSSWSTDTPV